MTDFTDNENIFAMSDHLTKDQLVQYHLGQMHKEERYVVEKHLVDCELCRDALSGMALMPGYAGIDRIRQDIRKIARPQQGSMNRVAWRNVSIAAAVLSVIVFAPLFYIYFISSNKPANTSIATSQEQPHPTVQGPVHDSSLAMADKQESKATAITNPAAKQSNAKANRTQEELKVEPLAHKSAPAVAENFKRNENVKPLASSYQTIFIADLKTVDYSNVYTASSDQVNKFETGVRAEFKNNEEQSMERTASAWETHQVTYKKYLEDALINYKKGKYDEAIDQLNLIQSYFPKDLNALFYSGLCYYELGKSKPALARFSALASEQGNPYYEEAKWYKALSLLKENKEADAKQLLNEIINEGGFYKEQAQKKLAGLK